MTTLKLQTETVHNPRTEIPDPDTDATELHQGEFDPSILVGLMLGMQLRESLSEQDRFLLDKLAPSDRSIFLVHAGRFVYPERFDSFPLEHIGGCAGEQAFFSHRFCPEGEPGGQATSIQTALLNPEDPNSHLFGWFGPELTTPDGTWDHRFSQLVTRLRRAYAESAALADRLRTQLKTEAPTLIVDRHTERLLWLNQPAADLCGQERSALVDTRFDQVRTMLGGILAHRCLIMKRVSAGDIEVTLVTFADKQKQPRTTSRFASDSIARLTEQKLAGIIMAAELLKSSLSDHGNREEVELTDIIADEARELDDLICTEMRNNPYRILETE